VLLVFTHRCAGHHRQGRHDLGEHKVNIAQMAVGRPARRRRDRRAEFGYPSTAAALDAVTKNPDI
jgi:hypothetical protein